MKKLFLLLLFCFSAHGEYSILAGAITEHLYDPDNVAQKYEGKIGDEGRLIFNPTVGLRKDFDVDTNGDYNSVAGFGGLNSIAEPMGGVVVASGVGAWNRHMQIGGVAGGYLQDRRKFEERGVIPLTVFNSGGFGLTPIVGVEVNLKTKVFGVEIGIVNLITPMLTSSLLSVGF